MSDTTKQCPECHAANRTSARQCVCGQLFEFNYAGKPVTGPAIQENVTKTDPPQSGPGTAILLPPYVSPRTGARSAISLLVIFASLIIFVLLANMQHGSQPQSDSSQEDYSIPSPQMDPGEFTIADYDRKGWGVAEDRVVWSTYRIQIAGPISKDRLEAVAAAAMQRMAPADAAYIYFYHPGEYVQTIASIGMIMWGPDGDPSAVKLDPSKRGHNLRMTTEIN